MFRGMNEALAVESEYLRTRCVREEELGRAFRFDIVERRHIEQEGQNFTSRAATMSFELPEAERGNRGGIGVLVSWICL